MVTSTADDRDASVRIAVRAVRGATTVARDDAPLVLEATRELLSEMLARNGLASRDIVSVIFTATPDLTSEFPACAARALGWDDVPLLCAQEIAVPHGLPRCIRVLLHVQSQRARPDIQHVYLGDAVVLRPDLTSFAAAASLDRADDAVHAGEARR